MRLLAKKNVHHRLNNDAICLDVDAEEVVDCVDWFAINLINGLITCYLGDALVLEEVVELRRIEQQPKSLLVSIKEYLVQWIN